MTTEQSRAIGVDQEPDARTPAELDADEVNGTRPITRRPAPMVLGDDGADPDDPTRELPAFATADLDLPPALGPTPPSERPPLQLGAASSPTPWPIDPTPPPSAPDGTAANGSSPPQEGSGPPPPKIVRIGFDDLPEVEPELLGLSRRVGLLPPPEAGDQVAAPGGVIRIGDEGTEAPVVDPRLRARRLGVRRAVGRKRLRTILVAGAVAAVVVGAFVVLRSPFLSVREVELEGAAYVSRERMARLVSELGGEPLVSVDLDRVRDDLAADPWVKDVSVQRRWPDGIKIDLIERSPVAAYRGADQGWRVLDADGHVIALLPPGHKPADLLVITPGQPAPDLEVGQVAPRSVVEAATVVSRLPPPLRPQVQQLVVGEQGGLELALASGATIRLGSIDRIRDKLISTLVVLDRVDPATVQVLDVQVPDRPVLTPRTP